MKCLKKEIEFLINKVDKVVFILKKQIQRLLNMYLNKAYLQSIKSFLILKCNGLTFMDLQLMHQTKNTKIFINFFLI
jgi:hypothetical protein